MSPPLEVRKASSHEVAALAAVIVAALVVLLIPGAESRAIAGVLPSWAHPVFYLGLIGGAAVALWGAGRTEISLRRGASITDGLLLERSGLLLVGPQVLAYGIAVFALSGTAATFPALMSLATGFAHLMRVMRVTRDLRRYRRAVRHPIPADPSPLADPGDAP